jgi:hypothetical protein
MLKKIAFAFIAALVLANASVAFTQSAAKAGPYWGDTCTTDEGYGRRVPCGAGP